MPAPLRTTLLLALSAILSMILVGAAYGQTPTTTIENGNADTRFQLNYDGGLYIPGTFVQTPADSIPATGAGTRLMWYPAKAAFRAGRVGVLKDGTQWDAPNVGDYSVAFGSDTEASGNYGTAMGDGTTAFGSRATAMGTDTEASAFATTAMGNSTTASANNATAMGLQTAASGSQATAMGYATTASGSQATAMGNSTTAATDESLSIGKYNSANTSADGTLFVAGNGTFSARSNALVLDNSGNLTISGTLTENSDRRLKTDIEPLGDDVLSALREIHPVRYRFKNKTAHPSGEQIGLIAQDVRKKFPSLVSTGTNGRLSLTYSRFTTVLLKGLQEQQQQIDAQNGQIATLRAENEAVKAQQTTLKERVATLEAQSDGSILAGSVSVSGLLLALLALGGLLGTGLLWRYRPQPSA